MQIITYGRMEKNHQTIGSACSIIQHGRVTTTRNNTISINSSHNSRTWTIEIHWYSKRWRYRFIDFNRYNYKRYENYIYFHLHRWMQRRASSMNAVSRMKNISREKYRRLKYETCTIKVQGGGKVYNTIKNYLILNR